MTVGGEAKGGGVGSTIERKGRRRVRLEETTNGGEEILTWIHKKRTSGIVCIFKGTNPVNSPYRDLLLRLCALWQLSPYLEGAVRFRGPLGQWVIRVARCSSALGRDLRSNFALRNSKLLSFNLLSRDTRLLLVAPINFSRTYIKPHYFEFSTIPYIRLLYTCK